MQEHETCGGCRFYKPSRSIISGSDFGYGHCHRRAPIHEPISSEEGWPCVVYDDWCGDFEASGQKVADDGAIDASLTYNMAIGYSPRSHCAAERQRQVLEALTRLQKEKGIAFECEEFTWPSRLDGIPMPGRVVLNLMHGNAPK